MPKPITLDQPKQLVVEGDDEKRFFKALLRVMDITDVQLQNAEGYPQLRTRLKLVVRAPRFRQVVSSIGVVRDAEGSAEPAAESVRSAISAANLDVPTEAITQTCSVPKVSYFILPNNTDPGMLETVCLQSVATDAAMQCVDDFLDCVQRAGIRPSNMDKAKVQAFLASRTNLKRLLGEAADAGYWDWTSPIFDDIKAFLQAL